MLDRGEGKVARWKGSQVRSPGASYPFVFVAQRKVDDHSEHEIEDGPRVPHLWS